MKYVKIFVNFTFTFDVILALAALTLGLAFPGLNAVLAHGEGPVDAVQLVVQPARVAHRLPLVIPGHMVLSQSEFLN